MRKVNAAATKDPFRDPSVPIYPRSFDFVIPENLCFCAYNAKSCTELALLVGIFLIFYIFFITCALREALNVFEAKEKPVRLGNNGSKH